MPSEFIVPTRLRCDDGVSDLVANFRRSGIQPTPLLILRLADGRIRIYPPEDAANRLAAVEREFGAIEKAYRVDDRGQLTVLKASAGCAAGLSRNAAIFAASLGMATGALPNVDASSSPAGVLS